MPNVVFFELVRFNNFEKSIIINPKKKHTAKNIITNYMRIIQNANHPKIEYIKNCSLKNSLSDVQYPI